MESLIRRQRLTFLVLCLVSLLVGNFQAAEAGSQVTRTLAYHQISSFTFSITEGGLEAPILTKDGSRAAFAISPGSGDPKNPNRIFAVNADGSNQIEVDSYTTLCFCYSMIDVSADGSKIVSSDYVQLRIAQGDGSGALPLVALNSNQINAIAISGDATEVFFRVYRDTSIRGSDPVEPVQRGLWVINADGSGRRQIVDPTQMEALGLPPTDFFGSNGPVLGSSMDGSRVVFGAFNGAGQGLFGVNLDGTGLHDFVGRVGYVNQGGISSDGTKVCYNIITVDPPNNGEVGVLNFDGTERVPLADSRTLPRVFPDGSGSGDRVQLSDDGSRLSLGSSSVLVNTDGSGMVQQAIRTPGSGDLVPLLYDGTYRATMNGSATRFLYLTSTSPRQLVILEPNPLDLGQAPSISSPSIDPSFVLTMGRSAATVRATVNASDPLLTVGNTVLRNGLDDPNTFHQVMTDAGDGTFVHNNVATDCCAVVGDRTVRVQSGVRTSDNRLHATAVEFGPFAVLEQAP